MLRLLLLAAIALPSAGNAASSDRSVGIWRNPQNSVHVQSHHCGASMCGTVVWANNKAKADAAHGGTPNLIGRDLFKGFTVDKRGLWHGKVYVPDIDKTFSGTVTIIDQNTLKGSGCLVGRIGCKSQVWARIQP
jgi:uncharacterized protein (DUF2147 family)